MRVVVLGTGSADGWPNPFCTCASCNSARHTGDIRGQTGALVDGRLLIDCGPEIPRLTQRLGHRLDRVTTMLFTHAHPDHVGPAALLFRQWAATGTPLTVMGPPAVIAMCQPWVGPADPVTFIDLNVGEVHATSGFEIRALAANHHGDDIGPALIYDIESGDGSRLLYATDTGLLPPATVEATSQRNFDIALIEETFGTFDEHDGQHLDLRTFAHTIAQLRDCRALAADTQVVAVHLSHDNPPTAELIDIMRPWGVGVVADGTELVTGAPVRNSPKPQPTPHRTLVLGGARSGKSSFAEQLLAAEPAVTYVATSASRPDDPEWQDRIAQHRTRRPAHWRTLESPDLVCVLDEAVPGDVLLIDCLTLWLAQTLDDCDAWNGDTTVAAKQIDALLTAWRGTRARVVAVSNEVGSGVVPATASGRLFRDLMGRLNAAISANSDDVTLLVAGRPVNLTSERTSDVAQRRTRES